MTKWTMILISMILVALPVFADQPPEKVEKQDEESTGLQPEIVVPEQRFDFGYSPEGYYMVHSFKVRNAGQGELRIQRVRTTCGCTSAPMKKMQLEPGEETEVTVIFNSTRYKHRTSKSAIITSNDPVNRSVRVTFSANMDTTEFPLVVEPRALDIPRGEDPPEEMIFAIENPTENDIELEVVDYTADVLAEPDLKDDKIKGGKTGELEIQLDKDFDPAANYIKASVTLQASGIGESPIVFTVPIKGSGPK